LSTPASFGPSPRRQLAALAGAWLAALASARSSRPWGRSPGARCARQTGSLRSLHTHGWVSSPASFAGRALRRDVGAKRIWPTVIM